MGIESVKVVAPVNAVRGEPFVDRLKWFWIESVDPLLTVGFNSDQSVVAKHLQMLRYRRLADRQELNEFAHGGVPSPQDVENLTTSWFSDDGE